MSDYLYRVQITSFPDGAMIQSPYCSDECAWCDGNDCFYPDREWSPEGWDPDPEWIERFGRDTGAQFFWPSTDREYKSRSSAMTRKRLIESYGATAIIQRSSRIVWPYYGVERLPEEDKPTTPEQSVAVVRGADWNPTVRAAAQAMYKRLQLADSELPHWSALDIDAIDHYCIAAHNALEAFHREAMRDMEAKR